jgi:hypothetical protein
LPAPEAPADAPRKYQRGQTAEQKRAKTAEYNRRWRNKQKAKEMGVAEPVRADVEWCKKCQAFTTHNTKGHPVPANAAQKAWNNKPNPSKGVVVKPPAPLNPGSDFLPGHEKSAAEIEEWKPTAIVPGSPGYSEAER